ncbi:MAG: hypothetical protein WCQ50_19125, partial [Spirochaetota bacterium]
LDKRRPKARNVLIGSDEVVVKALERKFNIDIQPYDLESPKVFSIVELESAVPLEDHASLAFWRNPPISRNELLLNYIVNVLGPEIKDKTKIVKSLMYDSESSRDFDVLYWKVIAAIKSTKVLVWDKQPWEAPDNWIGTDPDSRLAKLYHDLRAYAYVLEDNRGELKTLGISSGKITYLSGLKLSINKIIETLSVLSQWRFKKLSGHQATFIISTVWSRK